MKQQDDFPLFTNYPDVLEIKDLQQALKIGRASAYKLLRSGAIQNFKVGNTYKIPRTALLQYIEKNCNGGIM